MAEPDVDRLVGKTFQVRTHYAAIEPYHLKNESDRRMEEPAIDASQQRQLDFKLMSERPQPFAPARNSMVPMQLVIRNLSEFPKKARSVVSPSEYTSLDRRCQVSQGLANLSHTRSDLLQFCSGDSLLPSADWSL